MTMTYNQIVREALYSRFLTATNATDERIERLKDEGLSEVQAALVLASEAPNMAPYLEENGWEVDALTIFVNRLKGL